MCQYRTVQETQVDEQRALGERVALARSAKGMSQGDLAAAVDLDRTALSKVESGARRVTALELARISGSLGRPLNWFLSNSPAPILSRRAEMVRDQSPAELDAELTFEALAFEVQQLRDLGVLPAVAELLAVDVQIDSFGAAAEAALAARKHCSSVTEPLGSLASAAAAFGLHIYSLSLAGDVDGLMLHLGEGCGVCLVNGSADPGRRRFTAAHELGHFLFDDEYSAEVMTASNRSDREALIDYFAAHFLMPDPALRQSWASRGGESDPRGAAVEIAAEYRVSWRSLLTRLVDSNLIDNDQRRELLPTPTKADFLARRIQPPQADLQPPSVPPAVGEAILTAYYKDLITADRALELLHGETDALPAPELLPLRQLKGDFFE
jgi:Zn-dependent peptidase ImmA (M78 family)/transcriptional regulator with XRE-family HTH domain